MKIVNSKLSGVLLIEPDVYNDERGFFLETWHQGRYRDSHFPDVAFIQDNHSRSVRGVLRGLHFQKNSPQGKLVQVCRGRVFDVAVDIRKDSKTYGMHVAVELSGENKRQLFVPRGFAHGFITLSDRSIFCYKCDNFYHKASERGIIYNDATLAIDWHLPEEEFIVSEKDLELPTFEEVIR